MIAKSNDDNSMWYKSIHYRIICSIDNDHPWSEEKFIVPWTFLIWLSSVCRQCSSKGMIKISSAPSCINMTQYEQYEQAGKVPISRQEVNNCFYRPELASYKYTQTMLSKVNCEHYKKITYQEKNFSAFYFQNFKMFLWARKYVGLP